MPETLTQKLKKPFHPNSLLPGWLVIILSIVALMNLYRVAGSPVTPDTPIDFKPVYVGQKMLVNRKNPYPDSLLKEEWKVIVQEEQLVSNRMPGNPLTFLLYPPHALMMLGFLSAIPYKVAYILWYLSLPFLLAGTVYLIVRTFTRAYRKELFFDLLLLTLAFKGSISAMLVGQPTFLSLFICFAGFYYYSINRKIHAAILFGLSAIKITLLLPFMLFLLFRKDYKTFMLSGIFAAIIVGASALWICDTQVFTSNYLNIREQREWIFDSSRESYPLNYEMITLTEAGMLAEFFRKGANNYIPFINAVILLSVLLFLYLKNRQRPLDELYLFIVLSLLVLLTTYHLFYDLLLLIPLYFLWPRIAPGTRPAILVAIAVWFIPINGILYKLDPPSSLNILYFTLPVSLLAVILLLLGRPVYRDKIETAA